MTQSGHRNVAGLRASDSSTVISGLLLRAKDLLRQSAPATSHAAAGRSRKFFCQARKTFK